MTADGQRHASLAARTLNRASALVKNQLCVDLPPERLFSGRFAGADGAPGLVNGSAPARPERILFVMSHERPEITVQPIAPSEVADRMLASLAEEDQRLESLYRKFLFAFPHKRCALLERAPVLRRELLHAALEGKPAFEVRHPYPVELPALYEALAEVCG
jgi:hypothetical protein